MFGSPSVCSDMALAVGTQLGEQQGVGAAPHMGAGEVFIP